MSDEPTNNIASTWRLCAKCETIELRDDLPCFLMAPDENGEAHHVFTNQNTWMTTEFHGQDEFPKLPGLFKSSKHCTLCEFFQKIMSSDRALEVFEREIHHQPLDSSIPIEYRVSFVWNSTYTNEHQFFVLKVSFPNTLLPLRFFCTIEAADDCKELADWLGLSQQTHDLYTNKETVDWMSSKLSNCSERHDCGADLWESEYLPERLLDVQEGIPKLVYGADVRSSTRTNPTYLALSYCWGTEGDASHKPMAKLTKESTQQFQTGIGEQKLSAVHRDTVTIAKALSIPYIWIDALCILQDDRDDWERQCEQMDKIYGCAYATILAAASTSSRESFLRRPRGLQTVIPFRSVRQPSRNGLLQIELRKVTSQNEFGRVNNFLLDDLSCSRLSARGWAYQERILSTRQIVFGEWNVHYLCSNSYQTMNGPETKHSYDTSMDEVKQILSEGDHFAAWESIFPHAARFENHSFTYPEDILPALSGLARLIQKHPPDNYLTGHWQQDLFRSLAWHRVFRNERSKEVHLQSTGKPGPYTVPSWSILCKEYAELCIENDSRCIDVRPEVQFCDGKVALVGTDPFGAVQNAHLEIRSHCFEAHTKVGQSVTTRQSERVVSTNSWSVVIHWNTHQQHCDVHLDYDLHTSDTIQDPRTWRWVLLGSVQLDLQDEVRPVSTCSTYSDSSQAECPTNRRAWGSVISDTSEDGQEPESANSDVNILCQTVHAEYSYHSELSETEEELNLKHDEGGEWYEPDLSSNQDSPRLADDWRVDEAEESDAHSDQELERYPYGLLLLQVPGRQEWYRVGFFAPSFGDFVDEQRFHPELELMTLGDFKEISQIETMTVL